MYVYMYATTYVTMYICIYKYIVPAFIGTSISQSSLGSLILL